MSIDDLFLCLVNNYKLSLRLFFVKTVFLNLWFSGKHLSMKISKFSSCVGLKHFLLNGGLKPNLCFFASFLL